MAAMDPADIQARTRRFVQAIEFYRGERLAADKAEKALKKKLEAFQREVAGLNEDDDMETPLPDEQPPQKRKSGGGAAAAKKKKTTKSKPFIVEDAEEEEEEEQEFEGEDLEEQEEEEGEEEEGSQAEEAEEEEEAAELPNVFANPPTPKPSPRDSFGAPKQPTAKPPRPPTEPPKELLVKRPGQKIEKQRKLVF